VKRIIIRVIIISRPLSKFFITDFELHLPEPDNIVLLILIDAALIR